MQFNGPEETGQSIMNMDTNEITIDRIIGFDWNYTGTDVEDELPTPVSSPPQIAVPAIPPIGTADPFGRGEGFYMELAKVMCDVSVLPSLVSPLQEVEEPSPLNASKYAAPAVPELETILESPGYIVPEELGCLWVPEFAPVPEVVCVEEGSFLQSLQEPLPPQTVESTVAPTVTDVTPPTVPLISVRPEVSPVTKGSPSVTECVATNDTGPDLSREGPFDARDAIHEPGQSPIVLDSMAGCQYRMMSYDDLTNRDDLDPSYGIHLHDPRMSTWGRQSQLGYSAGHQNTGWNIWAGNERCRRRFA